MLKIKLVKSSYGRLPAHRATLRALGLRKHSSVVLRPKNAPIMGMIKSVQHLVRVEEVR